MKFIYLLMFAALALPAFAQDQGTYKGTLGPVESVKVTFEPDHRIKIERELNLGERRIDTAMGDYQWNGNHLEIQIDEVRSNLPGTCAFSLEIRRKGVEGTPPQIEFKAGSSIDLTTKLEDTRLTLDGSDGWQLPLYKTQ